MYFQESTGSILHNAYSPCQYISCIRTNTSDVLIRVQEITWTHQTMPMSFFLSQACYLSVIYQLQRISVRIFVVFLGNDVKLENLYFCNGLAHKGQPPPFLAEIFFSQILPYFNGLFRPLSMQQWRHTVLLTDIEDYCDDQAEQDNQLRTVLSGG